MERFSEDYAARVTVAPGGGIDDIVFTARAGAGSPFESMPGVGELQRRIREAKEEAG